MNMTKTLSVLFVGLVVLSGPAASASNYVLEFNSRDEPAELTLSVGKSQIITSRSSLDQVVIGNPDIADIKLLSNTQVLILGMQPGHTNLVFRNKGRSQVAVMDVVVGYDITQIKRKLWEIMPEEQNLEIRASNNKVILSGQVASLMAMEEVLSVARSYVPEKAIVNLMQVGGGHQVMLEVRIAEISRRSLRDLGVGSTFSNGVTQLAALTQTSSVTGSTGLTPTNTPFLSLAHNSIDKLGIDSLQMTLTALERRGLAKVLAEPNLTALSGQEASFLAGGEVAIPVAQSATTGAITVEFKEFGIGLKFTPVVLDQERINIKLNTEVSAIDTSNSIVVTGFNIPALSTRRAGTTVEVGDGQSFAIAGLLEKSMNNVIDEVPGLGQIPILGTLFRSTDFQRNETELVIIVTPKLVHPSTQEQLALPTDVVLPPNMLDQYLFGFIEHFPRAKRDDGNSDGKNPDSAQMEDGLQLPIAGKHGHMVR